MLACVRLLGKQDLERQMTCFPLSFGFESTAGTAEMTKKLSLSPGSPITNLLYYMVFKKLQRTVEGGAAKFSMFSTL